MHLKSITLRGFKSFASTTVFEFSPGINAVVGPNGSGKSNLVDALSWVMGLQGTKSLRGTAMNDFIFAGAHSRSALGRAKVTLVIDNSDGQSTLPYRQIHISRTVFRSGGSEYELNGSTVRLADIQDFLADAGLGENQHTVVGQGQIDRALHATAHQRRALIEEAAGILKYRRRIDQTERKLESLKTNLERLEDLATELSGQLEPLGTQAETARNARDIQARVRSLRADLFAHDAYLLDREQAELQGEANLLRAREVELQKQRESEQLRARNLREKQAELDTKISRFRERAETLGRILARLEATVAVAAERVRAETGGIASRGEELEQARARLIREKETAQLFQKRQDAVAKRLERARSAREEDRGKLQLLEQEHEVRTREQNHYRRHIADLTSELAAARVGYDRAHDEVVRRTGEMVEVRDRGQGGDRKNEEIEVTLAKMQGEVDRLEKAAAQARVARKRYAQELAHRQKKLAETGVRIEALRARLHTLQESSAAQESDTDLLATENLYQVHEAITVARGWERAVSIALEDLAEAWVTREADNGSGGFSRVFPLRQDVPATALDLPEGLFCARHAIEAEPALEGVLSLALAETVLAPAGTVRADLGNLFDRHRGLRVICADGTVFTGYATLLPAPKQRCQIEVSALIQRAEQELEHLGEQHEGQQLDQDSARTRFETARVREKTVAKSLGRAREQLTGARAEHARLRTLGESAAAERDRLSRRLTAAQKKEEEAARVLEESTAALDRAVNDKPAHESTGFTDRLEQQRQRLHRGQQECAALEAQLEELGAQNQESGARVAAAREVLRSIEEKLETEKAEQKKLRDHKKRARSVHRRALTLHRRLTEERKEYAKKIRELQRTHRDIEEHTAAASDAQKNLAHQVEKTRLALGENSLEQTKRETKYENLESRVTEVLGENLPHMLETFIRRYSLAPSDQPAELAFDRQSRETELIDSQKKLAELGEVNPLALEEFSALEARHTYLHEQIQDLKKSRADMRALIKELNKHIRQEFSAAFEETRTHFERIFAKLFPQGEGTLILTDPGDPLDSGIDIQARPAGKKIRRLSLLSGGERALASLALLTAIFAARPAPFYVLDEAEAALDDRNLTRVLDTFKELGAQSQLIIITHKPRTVDIADTLFCVGMQAGVSTVISQDTEAIRQIL